MYVYDISNQGSGELGELGDDNISLVPGVKKSERELSVIVVIR